MSNNRQEVALREIGHDASTYLSWLGATWEGTLAKAAKYSGAVRGHQRERTFEKFYTLGSAIIADGLPQQETRQGAYARVGTLLRGSLLFRAYVAEIPGQLAGNEVCPGVSTRHEVNLTVHDTNGATVPGRMYTSKHEGHYRYAPVGEVVAAPIVDDAICGETWTEQRPLDIVPLDALLTRLDWGASVQIHPLDRDPFGPRFV